MNEDTEKIYVELVDTLKKHIDVMEERVDLMNQHIDVQQEHIQMLKDGTAVRDQLLKLYEKAMEGTEAAEIAKEMIKEAKKEVESTS